MITARLIKRPDMAGIMKQVNFGTAKGLTDTAKQGQAAVVGAIKGTFTTRGNWFNQNMRHGIKITPAIKDKLHSEVKTLADWLEPHEEGRDKTGRGGSVAVPTDQVRRNKRDIIPRGQRPKGLGPKAFKLMTKRGMVLAQRIHKGKRKGLIVLFGLEKTVRIKKRSTFREPIQKVVDRRLRHNIFEGIRFAMATRK